MRDLFAVGCALWAALALPPAISGQDSDLSAASWLAGCWVAAGTSTRAEEIWLAPAGGTMVGATRTIRGETTTAYEFLIIHPKDGQLLFTAQPSGQAMADFLVTELTTVRLTLENPDHDFPKKIEYVVVSRDSVTAHVYGGVQDPTPAFSLMYARGSCGVG